MKNHLKYAIAALTLLSSLGLGSMAQADNSVQQQASAPQVVSVQLAWQRVGAPTSLEG
jgi:hypothetical protein